VFWTDRDDAPASRPCLHGTDAADLVVIGGGFTGLWTAVCAKQADPGRDVVLLEAQRIGYGGSGRNGGFISASLTHGLAHGQRLWPDEMPVLVRLGVQNLLGIERFVQEHGIDAHLRMTGKTAIALREAHVAALPSLRDMHDRWGEHADILDAEAIRADVDSPTYLGGLRIHNGGGLMDPARLVWGLARVAEDLGVRIYEQSQAASLSRSGAGVPGTR
jgi:glycine/D-amino acid oxidase-like deaminating enzyme